MNVKIDTKEKFCVITPQDAELTANMTAEFQNLLLLQLKSDVKNVVLNLNAVSLLAPETAEMLMQCQQHFYEQLQSFVVCNLQTHVEAQLEAAGLLELMNITPTESEAWDVVQMEEIERELMDGEEE